MAVSPIQYTPVLLEALFDSTTDAVFVIDLQGRYVVMNATGTRALGYSRQEIIGKTDYDLVPRDVADALVAADRQIRESGQVRTFVEKVRFNGGTFFYSTTKGPLRNAQGEIVGVFGISRDITGLESANSLFRATLDSTADGILVVDCNDRITGYNQVFLDLWKIAREEIEKGGYSWALAHVLSQLESPDECVNHLKKIAADPDRHTQDRLKFKDGRIFERHYRPQKSGSEIIGRVFSYRDITEQEKSREKVEHLADRIRALADTSQALARARLDLPATLNEAARKLVDLLGDGCIIRLIGEDQKHLAPAAYSHRDPKACALIACLLENSFVKLNEGMTGKCAAEGRTIFVPTAERGFFAQNLPPNAQEYIQEFEIHSMIHVPMWAGERVIGVATLFRDLSPQPYSDVDRVFVEDLISRVSLAVDNAHLYQEAQRAIQLREDFMSIASHELKTPLTPLSMQLQLLSKLFLSGVAIASEPQGRKLKELIGDSQKQIAKMNRLIDDILDIARLQSGRLSVKPETVHLVPLVSRVIERLAPQISEAGCRLELLTQSDPVGQWDPLRIEQVITNLLTNALRFGAEKPIRVTVVERDGNACVAVQDFGIGIAPKDQARIFERFERAVSHRQFGGLGMGLFIANQIVHAHGGRILVESAPGQGSTFTVELPTR